MLTYTIAIFVWTTGCTIKYLKIALKSSPFDPDYNYELALLYHDWGKEEKALEHLKITLDIWKDADPEYIPAQEATELFAEINSD